MPAKLDSWTMDYLLSIITVAILKETDFTSLLYIY